MFSFSFSPQSLHLSPAKVGRQFSWKCLLLLFDEDILRRLVNIKLYMGRVMQKQERDILKLLLQNWTHIIVVCCSNNVTGAKCSSLNFELKPHCFSPTKLYCEHHAGYVGVILLALNRPRLEWHKVKWDSSQFFTASFLQCQKSQNYKFWISILWLVRLIHIRSSSSFFQKKIL